MTVFPGRSVCPLALRFPDLLLMSETCGQNIESLWVVYTRFKKKINHQAEWWEEMLAALKPLSLHLHILTGEEIGPHHGLRYMLNPVGWLRPHFGVVSQVSAVADLLALILHFYQAGWFGKLRLVNSTNVLSSLFKRFLLQEITGNNKIIF